MTYDELMELLKEKDISRMEFCEKTGISPQVLTNAKGRGGNFSASTMEKINDFFGKKIVYVTNPLQKDMEDFTGFLDSLDNAEFTINETERDLLKSFRELSESSQRELILMLAFLKDKKQD